MVSLGVVLVSVKITSLTNIVVLVPNLCVERASLHYPSAPTTLQSDENAKPGGCFSGQASISSYRWITSLAEGVKIRMEVLGLNCWWFHMLLSRDACVGRFNHRQLDSDRLPAALR